MTLYRYGALAWLWRALLLLGGGGGLVFLPEAITGSIAAAAAVLVLCGPVWFFGTVVAVRIDRASDGTLAIRTLIGGRRSVAADRIGPARLRLRYHTRSGPIKAPAAWVPVQGGLPVYVDLWAEIPDRVALKEALRIPAPWK